MEHFKNKELDSMCNRSIALLESLSNLGIYFLETGAFNLTAIQVEAGKFISKPEYDAAIYAMGVLSRIDATKEPASYYGEWVEALKKRIKEAQAREKEVIKEMPKEIKEEKTRKISWIKTLFRNLFKVTKR